MNSLLIWIWLALVLDALLGDPRWLPHPVRLIGQTAQILEKPARAWIPDPRLAGIAVAVTVIGATGVATGGLLAAAKSISPMFGDLAAVWILYTTFAAKDLSVHSTAVLSGLEGGDLSEARHAVSRMVGRDTESLDEAGIVRATVESVAENSVDGVLSPLFFAVLFGPVGAMTYKAVNTLDSTFGYRNDRYRDFGWASARIDDVANFIPARLSPVIIAIGAALTGGRSLRGLLVGFRDGRNHRSPNAGFPEAAFAGALGVQLGGALLRNGQPSLTPLIGDPIAPLDRKHIPKANALLFAATGGAGLLLTGARIALEALWS